MALVVAIALYCNKLHPDHRRLFGYVLCKAAAKACSGPDRSDLLSMICILAVQATQGKPWLRHKLRALAQKAL